MFDCTWFKSSLMAESRYNKFRVRRNALQVFILDVTEKFFNSRSAITMVEARGNRGHPNEA